jgi:hypothetical protein
MRTRRRSATALFAALVGVAMESACGSSGSTASSSTTTTVAPTSTTSASSGTMRPSSSAAGPTTTARSAPGAGCVAAHLKVTLGDGGAAAGSRYQTVIFTNTGDVACTLTGYPGVSLLDGSGARIGPPAGRESGDVAKVSLAADGGEASFFIHTTADLSGTGCEAPSASIAVIAPNDTTTMTVPGAITVCGSFNASPVVAGTTGHA